MNELLIEKVREHPNLYDVNWTTYRDQHTRRESWEEIGNAVNMTADKAKETWEKLRRCFANALNRRRDKTNVQSAKKITVWKYEQQMSFLLPYFENRRSYSNLELTHLQENIEAQDDLFLKNDQQKKEGDFEPQESCFDLAITRNEQVPSPLHSYANLQPMDQSKMAQRLKNKTRRRRQGKFQKIKVMRETEEVGKFKYEGTKWKQHDLDESDMFYLSMSKTAKRLPAIDQARIKLLISNSILQAEITNAEVKEEGQDEII